jgi:hypothetical protein
MAELVERYVHQVGRYLPKKDRADIEAELRSLIQDQLDDRFAGAPSQADVATVLAEMGSPRQMAASYNRDQYFVGPDLYPYLIMTLRYVWVFVPALVIFLNIFGAVVSAEQEAWLSLFVETVATILQATLILSAAAMLIFAFIQRVMSEIDQKAPVFNPMTLPKIDDPYSVDRFEAMFGVVFGALVMLVLLYFLTVGGLTLRFNLNDPGEVIPVPTIWLIPLISSGTAMVILNIFVLRRNRWNIGLWVTQSILELFGMVCLYFVIYKPVAERIIEDNPSLAGIASLPEIIVVVTAVITVLGNGTKLVGLLSYQSTSTPPFTIKTDS